jgi:hypothetical protein
LGKPSRLTKPKKAALLRLAKSLGFPQAVSEFITFQRSNQNHRKKGDQIK